MQDRASSVGLTTHEARARIRQYGYNEIEERRLASFLGNFIKILLDPMGLMLLILSIVYWLLGKTSDATILLIAYFPIVGIDVILEMQSQKALRALKKSLQTTCHVLRDGKTNKIHIRELVPGDILVLEEGQTLPADGILHESSNLTIDESSLTGESVPVEKAPGSMALSGSTILTGNGLLEIEKTGLNSQLGSIAKVLMTFEATPSPLLRTIKKAVRLVFFGALGLGITIFLVSLARNHTFGESLIASLTLAMAAIPEEFPLVFTLYLSLAAYRLSKRGILVKSLPAVEGLGRVDVICTDKTGTLTEGKFVLEEILEVGPSVSPDILSRALIFSCESKAIDAMESSIFELVRARWDESHISETQKNWELQYDYSFDPKDKYMCHVWRERSSSRQLLAMKGAIEGVLVHCDPKTDKASVLKLAHQQAKAGKRLLGLAYLEGTFTGNRSEDEKGLKFLGILSFADPIRPSVPSAIAECNARGVRLKMLTGDHLLTAHAIADSIGIPHDHEHLFSGPDLEQLAPSEKRAAYLKGAIFARLKPEQKLELVQTLKSEGDVVAMTGDGINDAPALKLADIGISMGERATDVARSSAQMVLLKNDFGGIVDSIVEGQNVLQSLSESFGYLIAFHIPIITIALAQTLFFDQPILKPIHIVLLELIVHPVSAFVFAQTPNNKNQSRESFFATKRILWSSLRGIVLSAICLFIFFYTSGTESERSGLAMLSLVAGNIGLLLAEAGGLKVLRRRPIRALTASFFLILVVLALSYVPLLGRTFMTENPSLESLSLILALGIALGFLSQSR